MIGRLAGPEAEQRFIGQRNHGGAQFDHDNVADVAFNLAGGDEAEANAHIRWLACRAARLVREAWPQIERVATMLLDLETVSGRELQQVLERDQRIRELRAAWSSSWRGGPTLASRSVAA